MPGDLSEHFVDLPLIGIQFVSEVLKDGILDFFTVRTADFRALAYRECKEDAALFWSHAL